MTTTPCSSGGGRTPPSSSPEGAPTGRGWPRRLHVEARRPEPLHGRVPAPLEGRHVAGHPRPRAPAARPRRVLHQEGPPVSTKVFTLARAPTSSASPAAHPSRHPVMLYVLENEWNSMATSRAPSISRIEGGR